MCMNLPLPSCTFAYSWFSINVKFLYKEMDEQKGELRMYFRREQGQDEKFL